MIIWLTALHVREMEGFLGIDLPITFPFVSRALLKWFLKSVDNVEGKDT